jgi:hypothetical protein
MEENKVKTGKRAISMLLALVMMLGMLQAFTLQVTASDEGSAGTFDLELGEWTYGASETCEWDGTVLSVGSGADITITGTAAEDNRHIVVREGAKNVRIALHNLTVGNLDYGVPAILLNTGAEVTLVLPIGTSNTLYGGDFNAAVQVMPGASLTIEGEGSLEARGGYAAAGIGAGFNVETGELGASGNIIINGGNVTAVGGEAFNPVADGPAFVHET